MSRACLRLVLALACAVTGLSVAVAPAGAAVRQMTWWQTTPANGAIEAYADEVSAFPGDDVALRVNVPSGDRYRIRVFRLDASPNGATRIDCGALCHSFERGVAQPAAVTDPVTNEIRAPWSVTERLHVGEDWPSGYYVIQFALKSGPQVDQAAWTPLIVKKPASAPQAPIVVEIPISTAAAYNEWGGLSAYSGGPWSDVVSLDRPFKNGLLGGEYPLLRFLYANGFDVDVQTDLDTDADPESLTRHRVAVVAGHDEYWTQATSDAWYAAKKAGVNLVFFGANIGYWRTRLQDDGRSIAIYKHGTRDPLGVTGYYRDTHPECQLIGVQHQAGELNWPEGDYTVTAEALANRWMQGTGFSTGDTLSRLVSVEADTQPHWQELIGQTCPSRPVTVLFRRDAGGETRGDARAVTYVARSGARVFAAGSLNLANGLDPIMLDMAGQQSLVDPRLQRFTLNMFRGMTGS